MRCKLIHGFLLILFSGFWCPLLAQEKWADLDKKAKECLQKEDLICAFDNALRAVEVAKNEFGNTANSNYIKSIDRLSTLYQGKGDFVNAEMLSLEALSLITQVFSKDSTEYLLALHRLGGLYMVAQKSEKAEPLYIEAYNIAKKTRRPNYSSSYITAMGWITKFYEAERKYHLAIPYLEEAAEIQKVEHGAKSQGYIAALGRLAELYLNSGQLTKAEDVCKQTANLYGEIKDKYPTQYASILERLSGVKQSLGKYDEAEILLKEALDVKVKISKKGKYTPNYVTSLYAFSDLCNEIGDFERSIIYLTEAVQINDSIRKPNNDDYMSGLRRLSDVYIESGNYPLADSVDQKIIGICAKYPKYRVRYSITLTRQAISLKKQGRYENAVILMAKGLEGLVDERNPYLQTCLYELFDIQFHLSQTSKAKETAERLAKIMERIYGLKSLEYAQAIQKWGMVLPQAQAEKVFLEAIAIIEQNFSPKHPEYLTALNSLIRYYDNYQSYEKIDSYIQKGILSAEFQIAEGLRFMSEREKYRYFSIVKQSLDYYYSVVYRCKHQSLIENLFLFSAKMDGIILESTQFLQIATKDTSQVKLYDEWLLIKKELAAKYLSSQKQNLGGLEIRAEELEKQLIRSSKISENKEITLKNIRQSLVNRVLVKFITFKYQKPYQATDSIFYGAFLVSNQEKAIHFVKLFEENQLKPPLAASTKSNLSLNFLYNRRGIELDAGNEGQLVNGDSLYNLIIRPLALELSRYSQIVIIPSGLLHKIAFSAIPFPYKSNFGGLYNLVFLSSVSGVLQNSRKQTIDKIIALGNIQYDKFCTDTQKGPWSKLSGTLSEVNTVKKVMRKVEVRADTNATEEYVKSLSNLSLPNILHIATHGFYFSSVTDLPSFFPKNFQAENNALLRSGLILSFGNQRWTCLNVLNFKEDGILTAYEVSNLDLRNTELVVLSACETGLGDIKGSEGVFGLQRAFKMAGVKYLMMSLWKVPDAETAEMMQLFYTQLAKNQSIRASFRQAQKTMQTKYPNEPYKWAAFVLVE